MGKHISEFKRSGDVPEIFILLVSFFEALPHLFKTEGIFRIACTSDKLDELETHLIMGNYFYLTELEDQPHIVACFLKKVLRNMGEPICTFRLYQRFRDLSGNHGKLMIYIDVKSEEKV